MLRVSASDIQNIAAGEIFNAHDENNRGHANDILEIIQTDLNDPQSAAGNFIDDFSKFTV